ncbi:MAG: CYTH domain-containing protein, partial [Bacteroidales bacterium]
MAQEIERKFLVSGDFHPFVTKSIHIVQGYLSSLPERTVRVRITDHSGYLTIKGKVNDSGTSRFEWEKEITLDEAIELIKLCEPGVIDKVRHLVKAGSHTYEIDVFQGNNIGLVIAEIELEHENDSFEKPEWLGEE